MSIRQQPQARLSLVEGQRGLIIRLTLSPFWFFAGFLSGGIVEIGFFFASEDADILPLLINVLGIGVVVSLGAAFGLLVGSRFGAKPTSISAFAVGLVGYGALHFASTLTIEFEEYVTVYPKYMLFVFGICFGLGARIVQHFIDRAAA